MEKDGRDIPWRRTVEELMHTGPLNIKKQIKRDQRGTGLLGTEMTTEGHCGKEARRI